MTEPSSPATKRGPPRKAYYAAQFARTSANVKRAMRAHLRAHPNDIKGGKRFAEKGFGEPKAIALSSMGRKRAQRAAAQVKTP